MAGFDIATILDFQPPRFVCPNCRGLFRQFRTERSNPGEPYRSTDFCPVCLSRFVPGEFAPEYPSAAAYLREEGFTVEYGKDIFEHAKSLASLVQQSRERGPYRQPWPLMRLFFEVLARARHFVYFTSWGISHLMIGAFKLASMRVPVFGFVSNVEEHARTELTGFPSEAPRLKAHVIPTQQGAWDAPHQKLVVVDGLLAFTGSTNLTNNAMRKADRGLDISDVVTHVDKVAELSNRYFAPVWKRLTASDKAEVLMWETPF